MEKNEIRLHLNQIISNISAIQASVKGMAFTDFQQNEQVKESVYSYLQEIGQAALELNQGTKEVLGEEFSLEQLAAFRNARYNQEAEMAGQNIWGVITSELPEVSEVIEHSDLYASQ